MVTTLSKPSQVVFFNLLAFLAVLSISTVLATAIFCQKIQRRKAWYNLMISWLLYSISYLLIVGYQLDKPPPAGLCRFQATVIYSFPPLSAFATAAFLIDLYLLMSRDDLPEGPTIRQEYILALFPWGIFISVVLGNAIIAVNRGVQRTNSGFYCHNGWDVPLTVSAILEVIAGAIVVLFEVLAGIKLYRSQSDINDFDEAKLARRGKYFTVLIRTAIFTTTVIIGFGLSGWAFRPSRIGVGWELCLPTAAILLAIVLGMQRDILRALMFWKKTMDNG